MARLYLDHGGWMGDGVRGTPRPLKGYLLSSRSVHRDDSKSPTLNLLKQRFVMTRRYPILSGTTNHHPIPNPPPRSSSPSIAYFYLPVAIQPELLFSIKGSRGTTICNKNSNFMALERVLAVGGREGSN